MNFKISAIAEHCMGCSPNHNMDWNNLRIIKSSNDNTERRIYEALIIRGFDETSILNCHYINNIWNAVIEKRE